PWRPLLAGAGLASAPGGSPPVGVEPRSRSDREHGRSGYRSLVGLVPEYESKPRLATPPFVVEGDLAAVGEDCHVEALGHPLSDPRIHVELGDQPCRCQSNAATRQVGNVLSPNLVEDG